ncbi:hypothetical protein QA648_36450 (plasmid) [Rhizobium sp. CB3171]|uniref:hypothetical protein n=1 Tax=Rhizobium sp. CB3171 TaxID=3039157 RepID=UPI0024B23B51|nr:hypothetical protein [Rhizobium sp. CB3171]WFU07503.1 hypothetical protein QA648_36450 [Rhizobium sp. CB3171]
MTSPVLNCWICGAPATTGEHKTKRSDLRDVFGQPSQAAPLFVHDRKMKNRRVGSLKSDYLKSPARLCEHCNNARTQPYDMAWEKMSAALRSRAPPLVPGAIVRANRIFTQDTKRQMLNVHLYFVKLCGCNFVEGNVQVDTGTLGQAIEQGRAHPQIYLKFGIAPPFGPSPRTGMSNLHTWTRPGAGTCDLAYWDYYIGGIGVRVMYAIEGASWDELAGAWHPRLGTGRLEIADLAIDAPRPW